MPTTVKPIAPSIGLPATFGIGSDSYAEIIVAVRRNAAEIDTLPARVFDLPSDGSAKPVAPERVAEVLAILTAAVEEEAQRRAAAWNVSVEDARRFTSSPLRSFTRRKGGVYRPKGSGSGRLYLGHAETYLDPSF
jgi:hypothetical protein